MPSFILKVDPEDDLYVEWSTVVDNFVWSGTREELIAYGRQQRWTSSTTERIARTDETGTSALFFDSGPQQGAWDDPFLLVTNDPVLDGYFRLDRDDLAAYVSGDHTVLQPIHDEDES